MLYTMSTRWWMANDVRLKRDFNNVRQWWTSEQVVFTGISHDYASVLSDIYSIVAPPPQTPSHRTEMFRYDITKFSTRVNPSLGPPGDSMIANFMVSIKTYGVVNARAWQCVILTLTTCNTYINNVEYLHWQCVILTLTMWNTYIDNV